MGYVRNGPTTSIAKMLNFGQTTVKREPVSIDFDVTLRRRHDGEYRFGKLKGKFFMKTTPITRTTYRKVFFKIYTFYYTDILNIL